MAHVWIPSVEGPVTPKKLARYQSRGGKLGRFRLRNGLLQFQGAAFLEGKCLKIAELFGRAPISGSFRPGRCIRDESWAHQPFLLFEWTEYGQTD